jgi:hypothetical protein
LLNSFANPAMLIQIKVRTNGDADDPQTLVSL